MILNALPNIGPISTNRLLQQFDGDALRILRGCPEELMRVDGVGRATANAVKDWKSHFDLGREEALLHKHGVSFVTSCEGEYPGILKEIHDPPIGLYFLGDYRFSDSSVAIVGTRRPTLYGRSVARRFASELARLGFSVVSGMARGIDTEAHRGCMSAGGQTAAVMGCGLDIVYPAENLDLYREIARKGVILSEFPFGRRADRRTFPMRNRIVSGLCLATVVIESDVNGGSMITARFAGEQGRQVFAVPGRIDQRSSRGCNRLIQDGAVLLTSVDDILNELDYLGLRLKGESSGKTATKSPDGEDGDFTEIQRELLKCFEGGGEMTLDMLSEVTSLSASEVAAELMTLELKRVVARRLDGYYERRM